jgi:hypothetical protein
MKDVGAKQRWKRWPSGQRIRASFEQGFSPGGIEPGLNRLLKKGSLLF